MKTRTLTLTVILIMAVLVITGSCATGKKIISVDVAMKKFEGVYVNTEYSGEGYTHPQKKVITSDGGIEDWALATNTYPSWKGEYKVAESWMDSKGNTYCTVDTNYYGAGKAQELWKLDKSGKILEVNYKNITVRGEYPKKIDPNPEPNVIPTLHYCIWYRQ